MLTAVTTSVVFKVELEILFQYTHPGLGYHFGGMVSTKVRT